MLKDQKIKIETLRHSTAHLLAAAVKHIYPDTRLGIGPVIESGFYYDLDTEGDLSPEAFPRIEQEMRKMIKAELPFKKEWMTIKEAVSFFKKRNEPYKVELIRDLGEQGEERVSIYWTGDPSADGFVDLCTGPHVRNSREIPENAFTLTKSAAAYWRGDEKNPQLKRIYGSVFHTKKELREELDRLKEIKKRDHRKLGAQLDLFSFHDIAPGAPFWHPNGMTIVAELEHFWRRIHRDAGYMETQTPMLVKAEIFKQSGHWKYFRDDMFVFKVDGEQYALKPMSCPESTLIYRSRSHSYRDLPIRLSEIGRVFRNERSGVLSGLTRVRQVTQDDAHIYCREDQVQEEVVGILSLVKRFYDAFDLEPRFTLATKPDKALGTAAQWRKAEAALKAALESQGKSYTLAPKDGAFYGPKIDIYISDVLKRDWQLATIQFDLAMLPERFDLAYIDKHGKKQKPVVIHRAIFGSFERFIGVLLEHTGGDLPSWLAPVQVRVLPVAERHDKKAEHIRQTLADGGIRADIVEATESLGKRIRESELMKIPYVAVIGDREKIGTLSVRQRGVKDQRTIALGQLIEEIESQRPA